jgi:putative ABC transport system permease protein
VHFLFITACFILILAWINYVNLSTARAVKRAKEVGIRKVVGAGRRQLITQFLLEALLINLLSLVVAITLYQLCFPYFTNLVQKDILLSDLLSAPWFLAGIVLVLVLGTLLSGGYSAFVLSSFKAVNIMKGKFYASARGILLRKSLIVFQFVISVGLIAATFGVFQQLLFMKNHEMGYDMAQKLVVRTPSITDENYGPRYESFKTALQKLGGVGRVTASHLSPGDNNTGDQFVFNTKQPEIRQVFSINPVDYDYLEIYDIQLLYGRGFSREFPSDKDAAVITEEVALQLGFDPVETALQEKLMIAEGWWDKAVNIIGIAKNINLRSLKFEQPGVIFLLGKDSQAWYTFSFIQLNYFTVELDNISPLTEILASIEELYKNHFPANPFEYFFLDDYFNAQYRAEEQFGKVFTAASGLAIFIACLGLFGLSAFMVRQRTKEIGIRKVMGASIQNILLLLSKDYIKLVCLAGLIALPIAYFSLHQWLESYMVRIELSWWLFLIPVMIVISIALCTVSFQTIKAALTNPAKVLHND